MATSNDIEAPDESKEVTELKGMFKSDAQISINNMRLEFDNIFNAFISGKNEAERMKIASYMMTTMWLVVVKYQS